MVADGDAAALQKENERLRARVLQLEGLLTKEKEKHRALRRMISDLLGLVRKLRNIILDKEHELKEALTDVLTGLPSRRMFDEVFHRALAHAMRQNTPVCLMVLDLDNFKRVNDVYGHEVGDRALRKLAEILRAEVRRDTDFAARWGGEEFVIVLEGATHMFAIERAEAIRARIERDLCIKTGVADEVVSITVSIGVAEWDRVLTSTEFFTQADGRLYRAKQEGRNRVCAG